RRSAKLIPGKRWGVYPRNTAMRLTCVLALAGLFVAADLNAQKPPDFARAAAQIERKLRDPLPAVRVDGLDDLRQHPNLKALPLPLLVARAPDPRVRQAALQTLVHFQTDPAVRAWMLKTVLKEVNDDSGFLAVALLAGTEDPAEVQAGLDAQFKKTPMRMVTLFTPAEDLRVWADPAAV